MIAKSRRAKAPPEPLAVDLTVRFKFGQGADDQVTVMEDQRVPMVGSVFANRSRIIRGFLGLLIKTGLSSRKVLAELAPPLRLLRPKQVPRA